ncbi:E3 ubiquitin-protein ligase RFI2-like isoform X2 [Primulina huaijiensis]|uniref:E3 ubiquitin-protein ligase RFI2-like isoform X2 n=1 Tax=Primulina huaijiensis TaxID=1492673 RepID=UPI003CC71857
MGLGDLGILDDGDEGGGGEGKAAAAAAAAVSCSICLEAVMDNGDRSWAKLQCGHQFHLDCIGSAFNIKGAMQCPNCRKIEKGQWLYANGSRPISDFNMEDWAHDDDLYDLSYSEMSFGVHWCPFSGLTRLPTSFDEGEFTPSAYHDLLGHHAIFGDHTPVSSSAHPCPYIAYFGPIHPSSASNGSVSDGSSFNHHWSGHSVPSEVPSSYAFPSMDSRFQSWDHFSPFGASSRIGAADQPSIPTVNLRAARHTSDVPRPGMHPFVVGHSSARAPSSVTSSMLPPYPGAVARNRDRAPSLQAYFQQSNSNPAARTSLGRRSGNNRGGLAQVAPISSSSDQSSGFYFFSSGSSGRTSFQEPESTQHQDRFRPWEREHQLPFPLNPTDRDSIWGPFHPPASGSETGIRSNGYRQRYGSERMPPNRS